MSDSSPPFTEWADAARTRLLAETFLAETEIYASLDSTNNRALELATTPLPAVPTLVWTTEQTTGRGRGQNRWWSSDGALTFSLLLDGLGDVPPDDRPQIALVTGVAVVRALKRLAPHLPFGVKWPNDVYVDDRKVGGILVEIPTVARDYVVIGIGLNVNNGWAGADMHWRPQPVALSDLVPDRPWSLEECLVTILVEFDALWRRFLREGWRPVEDWPRYCVLTGRAVEAQTPREAIEGICEGISPSGALVLRAASGVRNVIAGTVRLKSS